MLTLLITIFIMASDNNNSLYRYFYAKCHVVIQPSQHTPLPPSIERNSAPAAAFISTNKSGRPSFSSADERMIAYPC